MIKEKPILMQEFSRKKVYYSLEGKMDKGEQIKMENALRVLTFDIEEWFHLLDLDSTRSPESWPSFERRIYENTDRIVEYLNEKKQKATFFCLGWIAEKYPDIIKKIDNAGFEIGSHSYYHQLAYELTPKQFRDDLNKSISILQGITGKKVRSYRVPGFSITRENVWTLEALIECGIEVDSSIFPAPRGHGGFENFGTDKPIIIKTASGSIKEFPINTISIIGKQLIFSGGGYFRLLPYSLIHKFTKVSPYVMSYFHPRDFDYGQPMLKGLPFSRRFKSYCGLSGAFKKFQALIDNFEFTDIRNAEAKVCWKEISL